MKGYEAIYGYEDEVPHYYQSSGIHLQYPDLIHYWYTYGTPENPNAGKDILNRRATEESLWFYRPELSPSVGLFQQLPASSWGSR